jgi:CDP-glycerol glycerophosphotransferase
VVPFRNAEGHLGRLLESMARQTFSDLEVIMVDDGSTDGSTVIAKNYAARDPRFHLIQQQEQGAGPGPARNTGVTHATGQYLAFPDSDGLVTPRGYELLIRSLDETGSDMASGATARLGADGTRTAPGAAHAASSAPGPPEDLFRKTLPRTHVSQRPALLQDQACGNKVCRRSFWDSRGLAFPGPADAAGDVMIRAHVLASSVDVVRELVYYRRADPGDRPAGPPGGGLADLGQRMASAASVASFLQASAPALKPAYDRSVLNGDLTRLVAAFELADEAGRARIGELAGGYLRHVEDSAYRDVPAIRRLHYHLLSHGMLAELRDVLGYARRGDLADTPVLPRGDRRSRWCAAYPFFRDPALGIPDRVYDVTSEMTLHAGLDTVTWHEGRLRVEGHAYIRQLSSATRDECTIRAMLRHTRARRTIRLPVERIFRPDVTALSQQGAVSYDWSGFAVEIEPQRLATLPGVWRAANWELMLQVTGRGLRRKGPVNSVRAGSAQWPEGRWVTDSVWVQPAPEHDGRFVIQGRRVAAFVTGCHPRDGHFEIEGWTSGPLTGGATLVLSPQQGGAKPVRVPVEELAAATSPARPEAGRPETSRPALARPALAGTDGHGDRTAFRARIPVDALIRPADTADPIAQATRASTEFTWNVSINPGGAAPVTRLASAPATAGARLSRDGREVTAVVTHFGYLSLLERTARPVITHLDWTSLDWTSLDWASLDGAGLERASLDGTRLGGGALEGTSLDGTGPQRLILRGDYADPGRRPDELVLRHTRSGQQHALPLSWNGNAFATELSPGAMPGLAGPLPLASGNWQLLAPAGRGEVAVAVARRLLPGLPGYHTAGRHEVEAQPYRTDALRLSVRVALAPGERGRHAQRRLRTGHYPEAIRRPVRDLAVFDSFGGQHYSCNPRAIYEEVRRRYPDLDCAWITHDGAFTVPDSDQPGRDRVVVAQSREHYEVLAQARYVVFNDMLPPWFQSRRGQTCLQTWHGTPLKRIGLDIARPQFTSGPIYSDLLRQDVSHWDLLLSANEFSTPVFRRAFGYDGEIMESGYPRNDSLHAPDREQRAAAVRQRLGLPDGKRVVLYAPTWRDDAAVQEGRYQFDLRLDTGAAADALGGDHVLLLRLHTKARRDPLDRAGGFVVDVTRYPDITDLYLISDVLITDYSSVMFDFAGTGRPMLFFTYDLESYRDSVRGFYFDFEAEAPGPLLATSADVIEALRDTSGVPGGYREAYQAFAAKYCALEDGHAAGRVADRLFRER